VRCAGYEGGQPTQITDPFGELITIDYDDRGLLLSKTERGLTTRMTYDAVGRMLTADYGHGATVEYEYGDSRQNNWTAIEGPTFGRVERTFSSRGRLSSWVEPNGDEFTMLYDPTGRVSEEIDALGNRTTYGYDASGRLQAITDATLNATTTFERDAAGRVARTVDALQDETLTTYKKGGRLASTTNGRGFTTSFDRDPTSSSITDALSRTTVTHLTALGLPLGTDYPGGAATSSDYLGTTRLDGAQSFPTSF
jgi:YD repeat-containing protein